MKQAPETSRLRPDWRIFFIPYLIGILLIPFLGAGIWVIYHYWKKWKNRNYIISDSAVYHREGFAETIIPISMILSCETTYPPLARSFGFGNIVITYREQNDDKKRPNKPGTVVLEGIEGAEKIAVIIENAACSDRDRMRMRLESETAKPLHSSGTLEKKNELVGLWQQGLITEEEYQEQMNQFGP